MINKLIRAIRDLMLFISLLGLINIACRRTYHFLSAHEESIIHELDQDFLNQLYIAKKQTHIAAQLTAQCDPNDHVCTLKMQKLHEKIDALEAEYKKNSPGLAFLGPIGTTSIIFKERRVNKKLLKVVNKITQTLLPFVEDATSFTPSTSIAQGLQTNKKLISKLQTTTT